MAHETMVNLSFTLKGRHHEIIKNLAMQANMNQSEILRLIIESVSDTHITWTGAIPRLERPRFRWSDLEFARYV
jgi:hypothetical protein